MNEPLLTVKEASQLLKVNVHYVYGLIQSGTLPALKIGSWKIREKALEEFIRKYECYDITDINNIKSVGYYT